LENNVDVRIQNNFRLTALGIAVASDDVEIVFLLLMSRANIYMTSNENELNSAIQIASHGKQPEIVELMSNFRNKGFKDVNAFLLYACEKGFVLAVDILLNKGANVDVKNAEGLTLLLLASRNGHVEAVFLLLIKRADIYKMNNELNDAYNIVDHARHIETAKVLSDINQDSRIKDNKGIALIYASKKGFTLAVKILLNEHDVDVNMRDGNNHGWTAIMFTSINGHVETVGELLRKNVDVNLVDNEGWTALMLACSKGYAEIVRKLLEKNADVRIHNKSRVTSLMLASGNGYVEIVFLLLMNRADIYMKNE
jgi:ankyrin repeat protein